MTELRINGYKQIERIMKLLTPFIRFKKIQAKALLLSSQILQKKNLEASDLRMLVDNILLIQGENYRTRKKRNKIELCNVLGLTP